MKPNSLGVFYNGSATKIAEITDGTSNTFLIAETAHGKIAPIDEPWWHHWFAGDHGDTEVDAMYSAEPGAKFPEPYSGTYYNCTGDGVGIFFRLGDELPSRWGQYFFCRRVGPLRQGFYQYVGDCHRALGFRRALPPQMRRTERVSGRWPGHPTGRLSKARDPAGGEVISADQY